MHEYKNGTVHKLFIHYETFTVELQEKNSSL